MLESEPPDQEQQLGEKIYGWYPPADDPYKVVPRKPALTTYRTYIC